MIKQTAAADLMRMAVQANMGIRIDHKSLSEQLGRVEQPFRRKHQLLGISWMCRESWHNAVYLISNTAWVMLKASTKIAGRRLSHI